MNGYTQNGVTDEMRRVADLLDSIARAAESEYRVTVDAVSYVLAIEDDMLVDGDPEEILEFLKDVERCPDCGRKSIYGVYDDENGEPPRVICHSCNYDDGEFYDLSLNDLVECAEKIESGAVSFADREDAARAHLLRLSWAQTGDDHQIELSAIGKAAVAVYRRPRLWLVGTDQDPLGSTPAIEAPDARSAAQKYVADGDWGDAERVEVCVVAADDASPAATVRVEVPCG